MSHPESQKQVRPILSTFVQMFSVWLSNTGKTSALVWSSGTDLTQILWKIDTIEDLNIYIFTLESVKTVRLGRSIYARLRFNMIRDFLYSCQLKEKNL